MNSTPASSRAAFERIAQFFIGFRLKNDFRRSQQASSFVGLSTCDVGTTHFDKRCAHSVQVFLDLMTLKTCRHRERVELSSLFDRRSEGYETRVCLSDPSWPTTKDEFGNVRTRCVVSSVNHCTETFDRAAISYSHWTTFMHTDAPAWNHSLLQMEPPFGLCSSELINCRGSAVWLQLAVRGLAQSCERTGPTGREARDGSPAMRERTALALTCISADGERSIRVCVRLLPTALNSPLTPFRS
ncbi:hypothetical protein F2P81_004360 [Scophthalmus maximus]|uniref:Uncharacterized protein n=1 Tax=Scophthalmus maximus TaxID=52904 RepID=A0A6A4TAH9_SCOMX|nr:hypothetical protein F2P81_004360 [Scophthalmus maximus]